MPYRAQTLSIQKAVAELGHDPGPLDGWFGPKTAAGVQSWLDHQGEPKPTAQVGGLHGVVLHWTAGSHKASGTDREHYHYIVEGDGTIVTGDHPPEDNISTSDDVYAAHVSQANTGRIGVAVAAMAGADDWPMDPGPYPITEAQIDALVRLTADLCRRYGIDVTRETVLTHAEVQPTLGIPQAGKWDITWLPPMTQVGDAIEIGDTLRDRVRAALQS